MALGRIGGGVLKDNLERNGSNLNFKNTSGAVALLHLDVVNSRVGINTESAASGYSLTLPTPLYTQHFNADYVNTQNWTIDTSRIYQNSGDINLSGANSVFLSGLLTDNLTVRQNTIRSNQSNETISLEPSGTGTVEIFSDWNSTGDIHASGNITFGGDLVLGDDDDDTVTFQSDVNSHILPDVNDVSELGASSKNWNELRASTLNSASVATPGLNVNTNVITATQLNTNLNLSHTVSGKTVDANLVLLKNGTISTTGITLGFDVTNELSIISTTALTLPIGDSLARPTTEGGLRFNNATTLFEGRADTGYMPLGGVYSDDSQTSLTAHPTNDTILFRANNTTSGVVNSTGIELNALQVGDVNFNGSTLTTTTTDTNLNLVPAGTGKIVIDNITFNSDGTITNTTNTVLTIDPTGQGYHKVLGTNGVVIPYGTDGERWAAPAIGDTRWNTDLSLLETWNGTQYIGSAGASGTVTAEYAADLFLQYTIILG
jgi:hypothetical protein